MNKKNKKTKKIKILHCKKDLQKMARKVGWLTSQVESKGRQTDRQTQTDTDRHRQRGV